MHEIPFSSTGEFSSGSSGDEYGIPVNYFKAYENGNMTQDCGRTIKAMLYLLQASTHCETDNVASS